MSEDSVWEHRDKLHLLLQNLARYYDVQCTGRGLVMQLSLKRSIGGSAAYV
jgi:hypothetical protein